MSEMSMLMHGMGLEAFVDDRPSDNYVRGTVEVDELAGIDSEARVMRDNVAAAVSRVDGLIEAAVYGEEIRPALSENTARELQNRVIAVLGGDRAARLVGSVESYNGPLAGSLLDAGLESLGGLIQTAIDTLLKLIRTGIQILVRFLTSAKRVLGRQLQAIGVLKKTAADKPTWQPSKFEITGADIAALRAKQASSADTDFDVNWSGETAPLVGAMAIQLAMYDKDHGLSIPAPFTPALTQTAQAIKTIVVPAAAGLDKQFNALLSLTKDSVSLADDTQRFAAAAQLTLGKFVPLSKMLHSNRFSTDRTHGYITPQLLGNKVLLLRAPVAVFTGKGPGGVTDALIGMRETTVNLVPFNGDFQTLRGVPPQPRALSREDGLQALRVVEELLRFVIDNALSEAALKSSKNAEAVVKTVLPGLSVSAVAGQPSFGRHMTQAIATYNQLGTELPRRLISYCNNLSEATKRYVELSAGLA